MPSWFTHEMPGVGHAPIASVTPCSSRWRSLKWRILRPDAQSIDIEPHVRASGSVGPQSASKSGARWPESKSVDANLTPRCNAKTEPSQLKMSRTRASTVQSPTRA